MNLNQLSKHERERFDFAVIADWIPPGERVLDLGCGDGNLLRYLHETRQISGWIFTEREIYFLAKRKY